MPGRCTLDKEINNCPNFIPDEECKLNQSKCGFWKSLSQEKEQSTIRQERWYEQYYKKS